MALAESGRPCGPGNVLPLPEAFVDIDKKGDMPQFLPDSERASKALRVWTRTPIEHIYFAHAPKGTYTVYAHCYSWREPDNRPLPCTVQVRSQGRVISRLNGTLGPASFVIEGVHPLQVCQFQIR